VGDIRALAVVAGGHDGQVPIEPSTPLVGRVAELGELSRLVGLTSRSATDAGQAAPGGVVLLGGDAGAGKSRLVREVAREAEARGWRVLVGHCLDFGEGSPPYLPFSEALGRLATDSPELTQSLVEVNPAIERLHPAHRRLTDADGTPEPTHRAALFEGVHAVLAALAQTTPVLLVIEDLHWADQSTRDLLRWLFTRQFDAAVTILATYRSDDLHRRHPLRATLAEWVRLPSVARLQLGPLSPDEGRALIEALDPSGLAERDRADILARAEGNPFFIEELVAASAVSGGRLPADLADLLLVRLERLDDNARLVVRAASVAGRQVSHELLAQGTALDDGALEAAVRAAVEANILVSVDGTHYTFRHALLDEAIYEDLLPGERVRLHAAYAAALAERRVEGSAAELARHALASHDLVTATRASIEAGDDAMAVGGPEEAAHHYERALELLADPAVSAELSADPDAPGYVDRIGLVVRASSAAFAAGHLSRSLALALDQLEATPPGGPPADRARLINSVAMTAFVMDHNVDVLSLTTEAVRAMSDEPPSPLHAYVLYAHARANYERSRDEDVAKWATAALQMARELNLTATAADARILLAKIDERSGDAGAALSAVEQAITEAREAHEQHAELRGLYTLGTLYYSQGRLTEALDAYQEAATRAAELGRQWAPYGVDAVIFGAIVALVSGDWDRVARMVDMSGQRPPEISAGLFAAIALELAAGRGDTAALADLPRIRKAWPLDGLIVITSAAGAIELYGQTGDVAAALAIHDEAVAAVGEMWQRPAFHARVRLAALLLGVLADAAEAESATERAALVRRGDEIADAAYEITTTPLYTGPEGRAWAARLRAEQARLRWRAGLDAPALAELTGCWREAVAAFAEFGHVYETARSRARLAAVLAAAGDPQSGEEADQAAAVARSLGARALLAEIGRLTGPEPGAAGGPAGRDNDALTARELDVLELVATGRSNREIAAALFISPKTVSVHISRVLDKLDAASRTEAVAIARRRGLVG
jgi:DNA-binding CsgD family transcriptional regulator/tetratricopeptide (TPR) repeat protein